jgi:poly(ADP-ribose) glycohydrolase ARH3
MQELEKPDEKDEFLKLDGAEDEFRRSYVKKLKTVKKFLEKAAPPDMEEIHNELGVHVAALHSVPTAIYCFLAARNPIPGIETDNQFQRCVQFAISLGGDTDTIACMAGSISGAHLGIEGIPTGFLRHCEGVDNLVQLADDLCSSTGLEKGSVKSAKGVK